MSSLQELPERCPDHEAIRIAKPVGNTVTRPMAIFRLSQTSPPNQHTACLGWPALAGYNLVYTGGVQEGGTRQSRLVLCRCTW
jgi:hypothetical protein